MPDHSDTVQSLSVLVTGGAGFIGSHVVDALLEAGHRVTAVDDLSTGRRENVAGEARLEILDIRSPETASLLAGGGFDVLVHHAAQMDVRRSTEDPMFDADINVIGTLRLVKAAVEGGVGQVIFASTGGAVYGEQETFPATESHPTRPISPYGVSKLAGERYLYYFHVEHAIDVACLRYANVYGPRQSPHGEAGVVAIFTNRLLAAEPVTINGDGLQTRDYVYVGDVVKANLGVLGMEGFRTYNVGTGEETTVVDLYRELKELVGREAEARHGPAKPGEQRRSVIDAGKLREEVGIGEMTGLREGLAETVAWFRRRA